ncbi:MAG: hypothetical protein V3T28_01590 [Gemmatimonadales bacterium]
MSRLLALVGATLAGGAGWRIGAHIGVFTALIVSFRSTALGVYLGRPVVRDILP